MQFLQLIHKVRAGQKPTEAVEDIIRQGVSELRKRAFGDDADDARSLAWSREQAWAVLRALASRDTVPYHETLMNAPFKGEEGPLRSMEQAEMITVDTQDGRPSMIHPGRPIYHYVFHRLVNGLFIVFHVLFPCSALITHQFLLCRPDIPGDSRPCHQYKAN
jgi:RNA12 protein